MPRVFDYSTGHTTRTHFAITSKHGLRLHTFWWLLPIASSATLKYAFSDDTCCRCGDRGDKACWLWLKQIWVGYLTLCCWQQIIDATPTVFGPIENEMRASPRTRLLLSNRIGFFCKQSSGDSLQGPAAGTRSDSGSFTQLGAHVERRPQGSPIRCLNPASDGAKCSRPPQLLCLQPDASQRIARCVKQALI